MIRRLARYLSRRASRTRIRECVLPRLRRFEPMPTTVSPEAGRGEIRR